MCRDAQMYMCMYSCLTFVPCQGRPAHLHVEVEEDDHLAARGLEECLLHVVVEEVHLVSLEGRVA